jgi:nucleoid-associated protein YgaU
LVVRKEENSFFLCSSKLFCHNSGEDWGIPEIYLRKEENMAEEKTGGDAWDSTQWHVVKKGESLWKIAEQYYGDGSLYKKIFEANQDILSDPNLIKVGQKLRIP